MRSKNDSFVEQLHAVQRALGLTMMNTGQARGMFLMQLLNHFHYLELADKAKIPEDRRSWPAAGVVVPLAPLPDEENEVDFAQPGVGGDAAADGGAAGGGGGAADDAEASQPEEGAPGDDE